MSGCLNCGETTPISKRTHKHIKYCNSKCSNEYYKKTNRYYTKKNPDWGNVSKKREEKKKKDQARLEWYKENWLTMEQIAEHLGVAKSSIWWRAKKLKVEFELVLDGCTWKAFYPPEAIEKLDTTEEIPEGYITTEEAAKLIGYTCASSFFRLDRSSLPVKKIGGGAALANYYLPEDVIEWNKRRLEERKKQTEKNKGMREEKRAEKEAKRQADIKKRREERKARSIERKKIRRAEIEERMAKREKQREEFYASMPYDDSRKIIHVDSRMESYERKLFSIKFKRLDKNKNNVSKKTGELLPSALEAVALNTKWHDDRLNNGITHHLSCSKCEQRLPYTSFLFHPSSRGRETICRECRAQDYKAKSHDPQKAKEARKKNYMQKIRSIIGTTIKKDISLARNAFVEDLDIPMIWEFIEENLGYDAQGLCDHLESQFDQQMNWENHGHCGHGASLGQYCWSIDHVIPRSTLRFDSLDHPNFAKCWALENMRPLEFSENIRRHWPSKRANEKKISQ